MYLSVDVVIETDTKLQCFDLSEVIFKYNVQVKNTKVGIILNMFLTVNYKLTNVTNSSKNAMVRSKKCQKFIKIKYGSFRLNFSCLHNAKSKLLIGNYLP